MAQAQQSMHLAHNFQTELIQAEMREDESEKAELSLLMVHGQDHLMDAWSCTTWPVRSSRSCGSANCNVQQESVCRSCRRDSGRIPGWFPAQGACCWLDPEHRF